MKGQEACYFQAESTTAVNRAEAGQRRPRAQCRRRWNRAGRAQRPPCIFKERMAPEERMAPVPGSRTALQNRGNRTAEQDREKRRTAPEHSGSFTLEAAMVLPLFFTAVILFTAFFQIALFQLRFQQSLDHAVGNAAAAYYAVSELQEGKADKETAGSVPGAAQQILTGGITDVYLRAAIVSDLGEAAFAAGQVAGGSAGMTFLSSRFPDADGVLDAVVTYRVRLPLLPGASLLCSQRCRKQAWIGNGGGNPAESNAQEEDGTVVYMTEHGEVYHIFRDCTYLAPNVIAVASGQIDRMRNASGAKYHACPACGAMAGTVVYCTEYGTAYHGTAECSFLSHNIREIPLSQIGAVRCCSKCARRQGTGQ